MVAMTATDEPSGAAMSAKDQIRTLIEQVIARRAVRVVFQPIVDLNDGMVVAYEALCRPQADTGLKNADEMFHGAEECGLLWELERITRAESMAAAANWPRDVRLFLNSSPVVFADERFSTALRADLDATPELSPDRVVLEITERSEATLTGALTAQVEAAKRAGFQVAVDDAGAGTSGLNRMMTLRPQWIKLDRGLIQAIHNDSFKQNLVRFFVHFARMSGVGVIAEGIEEAEELGTLIGLGVRYGQGYYLGRPGERSQTMDPHFISEVRQRWADVDASVMPDPGELPMIRLARPALVRPAQTACSALSADLSGDEEAVGVVLTEGRRLAGWLDRETLVSPKAEGWHDRPAITMASPVVCAIGPDSKVAEALQLVCTREDHDLAQPLIVALGSEVMGVVRLRDLLRAAATESRGGSSVRAALTGLPARVRADQQIEQMICRATDPVLRLSRDYHADAAFIDIRRFADYNGVFGYEMGDRLIRALGDQVHQILVHNPHDVFLAHLGDDRFFITAREGLLASRVHGLMRAFENLTPTLLDRGLIERFGSRPGARTPADSGPVLRMGLRVLLMPGVFEHVAHPRDVYRLEQQLRQRARSQEQQLGAGQSLLITERRGYLGAAERQAA
jgi:EAL domain-containing protein (putative c-di-GMP-specific phosphodiesterase class I)/GGDEF domain-containing protein